MAGAALQPPLILTNWTVFIPGIKIADTNPQPPLILVNVLGL
jgi:hypothetical protein